jgi:hypothetical protein
MIVFLALVSSGCEDPPPAPFDTTGTYFGTWSGRSDEADVAEQQTVLACPLTITLTQDTSLPYPQDHAVKGTVDVDYSCLELPEWVDEIPPGQAQVSGLLADDGTLTLVSGGCGPGLCLVLALSGPAVDSDSDRAMDEYSGSWSFTILLAGVRPFGVNGEFQVAYTQ